MREWCNQAGLPHCSAHGLGKAGATLAAENGATLHQIMAIYVGTRRHKRRFTPMLSTASDRLRKRCLCLPVDEMKTSLRNLNAKEQK
jgi:hypothetical protein